MGTQTGPVVQSERIRRQLGVARSTPAQSHTFVEFDHEIISSHSPPSADARVTSELMYTKYC